MNCKYLAPFVFATGALSAALDDPIWKQWPTMKALGGHNAHEMARNTLGLTENELTDPTTRDSVIVKAFRELSRTIHPDRVGPKGTELTDNQRAEVAEINERFQNVNDMKDWLIANPSVARAAPQQAQTRDSRPTTAAEQTRARELYSQVVSTVSDVIDLFRGIRYERSKVPKDNARNIARAFIDLSTEIKATQPTQPKTALERFTKRAVFVAVAAVNGYRRAGSSDFAAFRSTEVVRETFEQWRDDLEDDVNAIRIARRLLPPQNWEDEIAKILEAF